MFVILAQEDETSFTIGYTNNEEYAKKYTQYKNCILRANREEGWYSYQELEEIIENLDDIIIKNYYGIAFDADKNVVQDNWVENYMGEDKLVEIVEQPYSNQITIRVAANSKEEAIEKAKAIINNTSIKNYYGISFNIHGYIIDDTWISNYIGEDKPVQISEQPWYNQITIRVSANSKEEAIEKAKTIFKPELFAKPETTSNPDFF